MHNLRLVANSLLSSDERLFTVDILPQMSLSNVIMENKTHNVRLWQSCASHWQSQTSEATN